MTTDELIKEEMLNALISELTAREAKAKSTIRIYLNKPVAISDHSDIIDEVAKWANYGAEARDAKEFLISEFLVKEDEK